MDKRILIAEDDAVCRRVLMGCLQKANYQVVSFVDGPTALEGMLAQDAPSIAILDWMMPGLSGLEVCAKVRAANLKLRPYIIIHSARTEKENIVTGLDAGADDYLPKPVNTGELMARLRVAERSVGYERELKRHITELEALLQRYNLLGELVAQQQVRAEIAASPAPAAVSKKVAVEAPARTEELVGLGDEELKAIVTRTLSELGLGKAEVRAVEQAGPYHTAPLTAWAGIILVRQQVWVDLLLEAREEEVARIWEKSVRRRPSSRSELPGVLAETQTILSAVLKAAFQSKGQNILAPPLSRVRRIEPTEEALPVGPKRRSYVFSFGDSSLGLTVAATPCAPHQKDALELRTSEVLAETVFSPNDESLPLLNQGALLNQHYVQSLTNLALGGAGSFKVSVFEPSALARFFEG